MAIDDEERSADTTTTYNKKFMAIAGIGISAIALSVKLGLLANVSAATRDSSTITQVVPMEGIMQPLSLSSASTNRSVRSCTFSECVASHCNGNISPFTCLFHNGGPHGGCSGVPWTVETCTEQCDLSDCDDLPIPEDEPSCAVPCTEEWCANGRNCGEDAPFQCVQGSARFGCSSDAFQW
eukprot:CAMPEP_0172505376 /NCGR_PEP_ID=MMETSP1066-20121228/185961_1 /TAXON_ID=671091 /ORGANISM="Coscinodiscus wailesii, Strain CCMP2513" /LENGTH=180 /DNA_ID=CAMNT_0013281955 /DNA_START=83 /DNA_END=622 /DNA_ORIENTATION=-